VAIEQSALDGPMSPKTPRFRKLEQPNEDDSIKALREIAGLLAVAYKRNSAIRRVSAHHAGVEIQHGLALSGDASVHGVVT